MKKTIIKTSLFLMLISLLVIPLITEAQSQTPTPSVGILTELNNVGTQSGYQTDSSIASAPIIIGTIISVFIGFLGLVFVILMVIAGYNWMTAQGNEEQVKKAQMNIRHALIGLIITLSAWSIWTFILQKLILMS